MRRPSGAFCKAPIVSLIGGVDAITGRSHQLARAYAVDWSSCCSATSYMPMIKALAACPRLALHAAANWVFIIRLTGETHAFRQPCPPSDLRHTRGTLYLTSHCEATRALGRFYSRPPQRPFHCHAAIGAAPPAPHGYQHLDETRDWTLEEGRARYLGDPQRTHR